MEPIPQAQYGFTEEQLTAPQESLLELTEQPEWIPVILREMRYGWTPETVFEIWGVVFPLSMFLTLLFAAGVVYCTMRILQIRRAEWAGFRKAAHTVASEDVPATHLRWNRILEHAQSEDEHKWRLAILECDIMLNELLDLQGFKGETIAEKMKQVSRTRFNSIDDAWEAHKVRNKVAHEGVEYHISERDKNHVINLYQRVFKEFGFI
ncbi:MAG: hypothetical protein AAB908_00215 [Patescibacteria group bacterium]